MSYRTTYDLNRPWKEVMEDLADDDVHEEFYASGNPLVSYLHRRRLQEIRRLVLEAGAPEVLEVGCGDGFILELLASLPLTRLTGIELSEKRVERARLRAPTAEVVSGDATQLPFEPHTFDITIASEVLEHIPRADLAVAEMKRVTRPGGLVIVTVPNERNWRIGRAALLRFPIRIPDHVNAFTLRSMNALFGRGTDQFISMPPFGRHLCLTQLFAYRLP